MNKIFKNFLKPYSLVLLFLMGLSYIGKYYKHDIKVEDRIIAKTETADSTRVPNIVVIDNFQEDDVRLDIDLFSDVPHGFITSGIIKHGVKNANIYNKNIEISDENRIVRLLTILTNMKNDSVKYDAINMSLGIDKKISDFSNRLGVNLNPENIKLYKKQIRENIAKSYDFNEQYATKILDIMDSLSIKGTKFYVAAGNEGKRYFNLFNLADSAINVGALDSRGEKASYSCNNSLINRWENGDVSVEVTDSGFNIFGGTKTDVYLNNTSTRLKIAGPKNQGTSSAAPRALVKDFANIHL